MKTIKEMITELEKVGNQQAEVYFDFCYTTPTSISSWRGIYAEPALGWTDCGYGGNGGVKAMTVEKLLAELHKSIDGRYYTGWKGGDYTYSGKSTLHIDNPGDSSNTEITGLLDDGWRVIILTEKEVD